MTDCWNLSFKNQMNCKNVCNIRTRSVKNIVVQQADCGFVKYRKHEKKSEKN